MLIAKNVPATIRNLRQWVNWKTIQRDRPTKIPVQYTGLPASSTDQKTWATFDDAAAAADKFDGVGFVFAEDRAFFGIDLDGCRNPETGEVSGWAKDVILYLNSYSEVSPSMTGVKVYCKGRLPFDTGKKCSVAAARVCDKEPAIEAYDHGRYFAVTGMTLQGMPTDLQERTEQVIAICNTYFREKASRGVSGGQERCSRLAVIDRARKYLERLPASVSGQGGHNAAFHAACVLVLGFGLNQSESMILMGEFNTRCQPPWSEKELAHKVRSAEKQPGERGFLRDSRQEQWDAISLPPWKEPPKQQKALFAVTSLKDAAAEYLAALEAGKMDCLSLGIRPLDDTLGGGVLFGEYVVIGARPSHGKTAFAMQVLDSCCAAGFKSAIISEEMSKLSLGRRAVQFVSDTQEGSWRSRINDVRKELADHFESRSECLIVESVRTVDAAADCIRWMAAEGVKVVAIDYAQLLQAKGKSDTERVSEVSKALRAVTNETQVALFVLAQLSREIEKRDAFVPKISDLRQSGQLEQDADVVLFLVWPHRIDKKQPAKLFQIWGAKNRNRGIREPMVECEFTPSRLRIAEALKDVAEMPSYDNFGEYSFEPAREF